VFYWRNTLIPGPAPSRASSAREPCGGRDFPGPCSPQIPDSPAAFLESCRGYPVYVNSRAPCLQLTGEGGN
jgi:hypothetical protein